MADSRPFNLSMSKKEAEQIAKALYSSAENDFEMLKEGFSGYDSKEEFWEEREGASICMAASIAIKEMVGE